MKILLLSTLTFFIIGCKTSSLSVRLKNRSAFDFTKITVKLGDTLRTFENLKSKQTTRSFNVNYAYPFSFTSIILTSGDTISHWPIDHVGEKMYKHGKITLIYDLTRPNLKVRQFRLFVYGRRRF